MSVKYTVTEASKIIGVCSKITYQMVTAGKLPFIRLTEKKVVIPKVALEKWLVDSVYWPVNPRTDNGNVISTETGWKDA